MSQTGRRHVRRTWAICVAATGPFLVGIVFGCARYAIPDRPAASDWTIYAVLLVPYGLAAMGCWFSPTQFIRILAMLTVLAGAGIAGVAMSDAWPTFSGGPPPDMPTSGMAAAMLLVPQYLAGVIATFCGSYTRGARKR
jgi:hypothetical protein